MPAESPTADTEKLADIRKHSQEELLGGIPAAGEWAIIGEWAGNYVASGRGYTSVIALLGKVQRSRPFLGFSHE